MSLDFIEKIIPIIEPFSPSLLISIFFQGGFYYPFFCFYTLWFVSGPAIIVLGNMYIPKWVREKVVQGVEQGITLLGHTVFLILTR